MDEVVVERGDEVERGEPLRLDERERPARAPVRLADEAAVHRGHARQRVDPHGVVERHDAERALAPLVAALDHVGERARVVVPMGPWHALRSSRRPRGIEDEGEIALRHAREARGGPRPRRQHLGERQRPRGRLVAGEDEAPLPSLRRLEHGRSRRPLEERDAGPAVLEDIAELAPPPAPETRPPPRPPRPAPPPPPRGPGPPPPAAAGPAPPAPPPGGGGGGGGRAFSGSRGEA